MSRIWTAIGAILLIVGVLSLLGGIGMNDTETATTCYESNYGWDSSGCITTEVDNSGAKYGAMVSGFLFSIFGLGLVVGARRRARNAPVENRLMDKQCPQCDSLLLWTQQDEQPSKPKVICPNCKATIWKKTD